MKFVAAAMQKLPVPLLLEKSLAETAYKSLQKSTVLIVNTRLKIFYNRVLKGLSQQFESG
jgi:hypothetical protein